MIDEYFHPMKNSKFSFLYKLKKTYLTKTFCIDVRFKNKIKIYMRTVNKCLANLHFKRPVNNANFKCNE